MVDVEVTYKKRDSLGRIIEYTIRDSSNNIRNIKPYLLKEHIKNGNINVINMTLTSNERLIDNKKEDQFKKLYADIAKSKFIGNYTSIRDIFGCIPFKDGNIQKLELQLNDARIQQDTLYFIFNYDYSSSHIFDTQEVDNIRSVLNRSAYKSIINCDFTEYNRRLKDMYFSMRLKHSQIIKLLNKIDKFYKYYANNHRILDSDEDIIINIKERRTNIGIVDCCNMDVVVDGIQIPVITGARKAFMFNESASDSKIYYGIIVKEIHNCMS